MISTKELFRRLYGDELADQVEQLKSKPPRIVWKPAKPPEKRVIPERPEVRTERIGGTAKQRARV